ncbi:hypothetical protein L9F63_000255, partial [Diploptera punctata]
FYEIMLPYQSACGGLTVITIVFRVVLAPVKNVSAFCSLPKPVFSSVGGKTGNYATCVITEYTLADSSTILLNAENETATNN